MTETVETLSLPEQPLDAAYFRRVLAYSPKAVIAAPCGYGKTRGVAAFIAEQWQDGILYVAERKEQLDNMKQLLVEHQGIDPNRIGVYHGDSDDVDRLEQDGERKPIALVTHARMLSYSPDEYVQFGTTDTPVARHLLICDEAVVPLQLLRIPCVFAIGLLTEMGLGWQDIGHLTVEEIQIQICTMQHVLRAHAKHKFSQVGIRYLDWTEYLPDFDQRGERIRHHAYALLLHQLLLGRYYRQPDEVTVLIPMAPHLSWFAMVPQIVVLDATAHITDYLYDGYTIVRPGRWNYQDIHAAWHLRVGQGRQSRTAIRKYQETFLQQFDFLLPSFFQGEGFHNPYVVTYKHLANDQELLPEVLAAKLHMPVRHYGSTRGSNQFLETDSAILLGGFRAPVQFDTLARQLYKTYAPCKHAVAHWIQELYRTRIRKRNGEKINIAVLGEEDMITLLGQEIAQPLALSLTTCGPLHKDGYEYLLRGQKKQTQRELVKELQTNKRVHVPSFAKHHTSRSVDKVWRALNAVLREIPELRQHIGITWAYKDELAFGIDPKGGFNMMIPKEKVEAFQEVIILR